MVIKIWMVITLNTPFFPSDLSTFWKLFIWKLFIFSADSLKTNDIPIKMFWFDTDDEMLISLFDCVLENTSSFSNYMQREGEYNAKCISSGCLKGIFEYVPLFHNPGMIIMNSRKHPTQQQIRILLLKGWSVFCFRICYYYWC